MRLYAFILQPCANGLVELGISIVELILRVVVLVFFALWLVATLLKQLDFPWARKVVAFDVFHILPRWTFFAPNPGTSDYHLVYRKMDAQNNVSEFLEFPFHERNRLCFLWNPDKRVKKALMDLAIMMNQLCASDEYNENNIGLSFSYVAILNFLSSVPLGSNTRSLQFALLVSDGFIDLKEPRLVICSEFHSV